MMIHLPKDVESSIHAAVKGGYFASVDDAMTEAARLLLQKLHLGQAVAHPPAASPSPGQAHKPIWEVAAELRKNVPAEEWAKLPVDGASQHDHYIYGMPKRPTQ